jgi:hypothetical protein
MKKAIITKEQFEEIYPTEEICLKKIFELKYKGQRLCEKCKRPFKYHKLKNLIIFLSILRLEYRSYCKYNFP